MLCYTVQTKNLQVACSVVQPFKKSLCPVGDLKEVIVKVVREFPDDANMFL